MLSVDAAVETRIQIGWNKFRQLAPLLTNKDISLTVDRGDWAVLMLLDLSAAFDTVDHMMLIRRLQISYGFNGDVLRWFSSYLHG